MKIGIVGCGNLGKSLSKGILLRNEHRVFASKRNQTAKDAALESDTFSWVDNHTLISESDLIIIALKPFAVLPFLAEYNASFDPEKHTLISVASSITSVQVFDTLGYELDFFRAMPNTAAGVTESITAIAPIRDVKNKKTVVFSLFNSIGTTIELNEELMEAATIIGACGIAYVLRFMRAMIQGGIEVGFDSKTATQIVAQTMKGAAELSIKNNTHPEEEIDKVTTPKGCTIVGLNTMEHSGFSSSLIKGIVASYKKIEK